MNVKILKLGAGPLGVRTPGMVCEVSEAEGRALIADRAAVALPGAADAPPIQSDEVAVAPPAPEQATARRRGRPRKG